MYYCAHCSIIVYIVVYKYYIIVRPSGPERRFISSWLIDCDTAHSGSEIYLINCFCGQYQVGADGRLMSLREQQVVRLQKEIAHQAGVRLTLRKKDCFNAIAFVNCYNQVRKPKGRYCLLVHAHTVILYIILIKNYITLTPRPLL